jgi:hypothetical protein
MGASFNRTGSYVIHRKQPLVLRYLLHAHAGAGDSENADEIAKSFSERPALQVKRHSGPHLQYQVTRGG